MRLIIILTIILVLLPIAVRAQVDSTEDVQATWLREWLDGDDNLDGNTDFFFGWEGDNRPTPRANAWVYFPTPDNMDTCSSCSLYVYLENSDGDADTIFAYWCTRDVTANEATMTYLTYDGTNAWTAGGGDFSTSDRVGELYYDGTETAGWFAIPLDKPQIDSLMAGDINNYGLILTTHLVQTLGNFDAGNSINDYTSDDAGSNQPYVTFKDVGAAGGGPVTPTGQVIIIGRHNDEDIGRTGHLSARDCLRW